MAKTSFAPSPAKIKVIGLGGGGCNAITRMVRDGIRGVDFVAMNTDAQALAVTEAPMRVQLGEKLVKGLGVGGDPDQGQKAAEESRDQIREFVTGADMVFITAGMGGGSGTGAAPVVADLAMQAGALTIAVVTKPFTFEGSNRAQVANEGVARLLDRVVDTLKDFPGQDEVSLRVTNTEKVINLRLSNLATGYCPELHQRLAELVGEGGIRLELTDSA